MMNWLADFLFRPRYHATNFEIWALVSLGYYIRVFWNWLKPKLVDWRDEMVMAQEKWGSYGIQWPQWWVYWRGRWWLSGKDGCCPNCYSSPPKAACRICYGSYEYGPKLTPERKRLWLKRWDYVHSKREDLYDA